MTSRNGSKSKSVGTGSCKPLKTGRLIARRTNDSLEVRVLAYNSNDSARVGLA